MHNDTPQIIIYKNKVESYSYTILKPGKAIHTWISMCHLTIILVTSLWRHDKWSRCNSKCKRKERTVAHKLESLNSVQVHPIGCIQNTSNF